MPRRKQAVLILFIGLAITSLAGISRAAEPTLKIDLDRCVEMALEVNISVLRARYDVDRAGGSFWMAASQVLPAIWVESTDERFQRTELRVVGDVVIETDRSYYGTLYLRESASLDRVMGVLESGSYKKASRYTLTEVRQDIRFVANQKYLEVLKAEKLLEVRQEALDLSERGLEKAQAMLEVGSAVKSDVLRAQVELSSNQLDLISARNGLRVAEIELLHFLGIDEPVKIELEDILESGDIDIDLDEALSEAVGSRPAIKSASAILRAAKHGVWKERGGWLPNLTFLGWYQYRGLGFPDQLSAFKDEAEWHWQLRVSLDLFDGLQTFGQVKSAKAACRSAAEDLVQLHRDIALEVRKAFFGVQEAQQRVKVSRETVDLAEEELRLAEERYRLGAGTMFEQIDSQVALSEARTSHIEALYDYLLSQAQLEKAMGKD